MPVYNYPEAEEEGDGFLIMNSPQPHGSIPLLLAIGKVSGIAKRQLLPKKIRECLFTKMKLQGSEKKKNKGRRYRNIYMQTSSAKIKTWGQLANQEKSDTHVALFMSNYKFINTFISIRKKIFL